ncbi:hypothetical protein [Nocardia cerradoensis]|uniref:Uncharacterized protein n=1 Tax=Nocardia cerradoensis TaxID=85688 RepID=A0A231H089_9NOCA|nr:hypothetical protein [Nocardia cerradoensis]NKY46095.1 hypothetical protein [Nocardia cerradoensis]OXR42285.1 hypothetical protein B7C42_05484 [Nocardia cerradoensis]
MATVLKTLLAERHLKSHSDFLAAYDACAARLDPPVPPGYGPAKTQYYQWLSGKMVGLPRDYHCRVLTEMFPGWSIESLFRTAAEPTPVTVGADEPGRAADDIELAAFLGAETLAGGVTLVYPAFELPLRSARARRALAASDRYSFPRKIRAIAAGHRSDALTALPEKEFRALLYVLSMLQRHTGLSTDVRSDREVAAHSERPYISFGLTGNTCTRRYLDNVERPLFDLDGRGRRIEQVALADGSRYGSRDGHSIGVIARVRPDPDLYPGRYRIFCAGLGPRGTTGAGWYLATSWAPLQRRAGDQEFVAVVDIGDSSDETARLEYLLIESE